ASGFRSNMSRWLGPPRRLKKITERALPWLDAPPRGGITVFARAWRKADQLKPPKSDKPPTHISSLRVMPSQSFFPVPRMSNMAGFLSSGRGFVRMDSRANAAWVGQLSGRHYGRWLVFVFADGIHNFTVWSTLPVARVLPSG